MNSPVNGGQKKQQINDEHDGFDKLRFAKNDSAVVYGVNCSTNKRTKPNEQNYAIVIDAYANRFSLYILNSV